VYDYCNQNSNQAGYSIQETTPNTPDTTQETSQAYYTIDGLTRDFSGANLTDSQDANVNRDESQQDKKYQIQEFIA
jgi:hypothetical protein